VQSLDAEDTDMEHIRFPDLCRAFKKMVPLMSFVVIRWHSLALFGLLRSVQAHPAQLLIAHC
jgi:hypothetical protein